MDYIFKENEFNALLAKYGFTKTDLAKKLNMTIPTLNSRIKEEGNFTKEEIVKMFSLFSKSEVEAVLFGKEVA